MAILLNLSPSPKATLFRGPADTSCFPILENLRSGGRAVSKVEEEIGLTQPNTSGHLACLKADLRVEVWMPPRDVPASLVG